MRGLGLGVSNQLGVSDQLSAQRLWLARGACIGLAGNLVCCDDTVMISREASTASNSAKSMILITLIVRIMRALSNVSTSSDGVFEGTQHGVQVQVYAL